MRVGDGSWRSWGFGLLHPGPLLSPPVPSPPATAPPSSQGSAPEGNPGDLDKRRDFLSASWPNRRTKTGSLGDFEFEFLEGGVLEGRGRNFLAPLFFNQLCKR